MFKGWDLCNKLLGTVNTALGNERHRHILDEDRWSAVRGCILGSVFLLVQRNKIMMSVD
jgi:hypothetical protein